MRVRRVAVLCIGMMSSLFAQGEAGYDFLRLRYSPLSAHFGDGWVAVAHFFPLQDINPAFSGGKGITASVVSHVAGIRGGQILWAPEGISTLSAIFLSSGTIPRTDASGQKTGEFSARFLALQGARRVWERDGVQVGVSGKIAFVGIDDQSSLAAAVDLGIGWFGPFYAIGAVLRNWGVEVKPMGADRFSPPLEFLAGGALSLRKRFIGAVGFALSPYAPPSFSFGALFYPTRLFGLGIAFDTHRRGLATGGGRDVLVGFSVALSLHADGFLVDYAYTPFGDPGDVHRLGVSRP